MDLEWASDFRRTAAAVKAPGFRPGRGDAPAPGRAPPHGDGEAGDPLRWVHRHRAALRLAALRRCRNPSDADDLVQETLEVALLHRQQMLRAVRLRSWLITLLHRRFINHYRHEQRTRGPNVADLEGCLAAPSTEPEPEWASLRAEEVWAAARKLDPGLREAFELYERSGFSYREISRQLGIPISTVGTRINRSRRRLRLLLLGRR